MHPKSPKTQNLGEPIRRYAKNTIRKIVFSFSIHFFTNFTLIVEIIILNPIGSYKVNFNGTIFILRPIFYLKAPLTKEIKQYLNDSIWDFDQRFKTLMDKASFGMSNVQNKEWLIATLVSHIWMPLMQQKIVTETEALEIAMKMEASPVGKTRVGMN